MNNDVLASNRILLVDDNLHGLTARKLILAEQGFDVETALSGEEAWEKICRTPFDIVVTDFRMDGMTGVELIERIHATDSPMRVILLSGFADCLGLTEKNTGADQVIAKSGREIQDLLRAVRKLVSRPPRRGPRAQANAHAAQAKQSFVR